MSSEYECLILSTFTGIAAVHARCLRYHQALLPRSRELLSRPTDQAANMAPLLLNSKPSMIGHNRDQLLRVHHVLSNSILYLTLQRELAFNATMTTQIDGRADRLSCAGFPLGGFY